MKLYQAIVQNHRLENSPEWVNSDAVIDRAERIQRCLPRGSGIDAGTKIVSVSDKQIVLTAGFHHMNEGGYYDGWTEHTIRVRASLMLDITVSVSGPNRNQIKDYLQELYARVMEQEFEWIVQPVVASP